MNCIAVRYVQVPVVRCSSAWQWCDIFGLSRNESYHLIFLVVMFVTAAASFVSIKERKKGKLGAYAGAAHPRSTRSQDYRFFNFWSSETAAKLEFITRRYIAESMHLNIRINFKFNDRCTIVWLALFSVNFPFTKHFPLNYRNSQTDLLRKLQHFDDYSRKMPEVASWNINARSVTGRVKAIADGCLDSVARRQKSRKFKFCLHWL